MSKLIQIFSVILLSAGSLAMARGESYGQPSAVECRRCLAQCEKNNPPSTCRRFCRLSCSQGGAR
jgi:hypothetical protein